MYFFAGFFLTSSGFGPKPRVLVLCFPDFTENSIVTHFKFVVGTRKVQLFFFCDGHLLIGPSQFFFKKSSFGKSQIRYVVISLSLSLYSCILYICWEPIVNLMGTWWEQQKSNTSWDGLALLTSSYMISCV